MSTHVLLCSHLSSVNQILIPHTSSYFLRFRPIAAIAAVHSSISATKVRALSTRPTTSSLNDSNPNWSNRPPKETIVLNGCDFEHWLVVLVEKPEGEPTRGEIYINTLARVVGRSAVNDIDEWPSKYSKLFIETKLIDASLLLPEEIKWVNSYHMKCRDILAPYLNEFEKAWLNQATEPIAAK